jgi:FAD-dependent urate hydroxylase
MLRKTASDCDFAIVGAGPYGLAVASHLRAAGLEVRIFGKAMAFWDSQMPKGMCLRSPKEGSHIADPHGAYTLERFESAQYCTVPKSMFPLEDFVRYGQWFQREALPDLDPRQVVKICRALGGFDLSLEDGEHLCAENVVVATGIGAFANLPAPFATLPLDLVSHTSEPVNRDLGRFRGQRVAVIGGGQSALESAALLHEAGAETEVLIRQPNVRWLHASGLLEWLMDCKANPFRAPGKIGPIGVNWLIENPRLFTAFPRSLRDRMTVRAIRPAGSSWLRPRTAGVKIRTATQAISATRQDEKIRLKFNDGSDCEFDHVLLGTGYKVSVSRMSYLTPTLSGAVHTVKGYPILDRGFESSMRGLYFVGATAAHSFGPLCRFVAGTPYTAAALTKLVKRKLSRRRVLTPTS